MIKFRAWEGEEKRFLPIIEGHEYTFRMDKDGLYTEYECTPQKNITLQMFTGLLDINGKEIYEGDIISTPYFIMGKDSGSKEIKTVVFHKGMFGVFGSNAYSFIELNGLYIGKEETKKYISNYGEIYDESEAVFEVIGNIYQNPDLLNN